jgi:hypothetical protein
VIFLKKNHCARTKVGPACLCGGGLRGSRLFIIRSGPCFSLPVEHLSLVGCAYDEWSVRLNNCSQPAPAASAQAASLTSVTEISLPAAVTDRRAPLPYAETSQLPSGFVAAAPCIVPVNERLSAALLWVVSAQPLSEFLAFRSRNQPLLFRGVDPVHPRERFCCNREL